MRSSIVIFVILFIISLVPCYSQEKNSFPIPQIEFNPKHYVCYRTDLILKIDGKLDESTWQKAEWTNDFVNIEGDLKPKPRFRTRAKMLWDNEYFTLLRNWKSPIFGQL